MPKQQAKQTVEQLRDALETMLNEAGSEPDLENPASIENFDEAYAALYKAKQFLDENNE